MTNAFSKIAKATLGLVVGVAVLASTVPALALTASDISMLQAAGIISASQAASLLASIGGGSTTTGGTCYAFTTTLTVGMTSPAVKQLQMVLNANPATALAVPAGSNGSFGHETEYFGPATAVAVVKYQSLNGISPTAPRVGPMTMAKLNACTSTGIVTTTGGTTTTNGVNAMLSTDNPPAGTVVTGQALADLAHYTFTGNGTISQLTLQRTGFATNSLLTNVYLYNGVSRITDAASVNSSGTIVFNNVNLAVNGSVTIAVKSDISSATADASSGSVGVTLTGYTVNGTTMTSSLMGNVMSVTNGASILATVQVGNSTSTSGATNGNTAYTATVNAGATQYVFWSSPVQVNTHPVALKAFRLSFIGSAPNTALANVNLYVDGVQVGTSSGIMTDNTGSYIMFNTSGASTACGGINTAGACLTTGSHTLEVRADLMSGSARTIQLSLQNPADMQVTDVQNNINVGVTTNGTSFSTNSSGVITINGTTGGSVTAQIDPTFATVNNITGGATNAVIGQYTLTAYGENEKVQTVTITPSVSGATPSTSSLNNVQLYYNGSQVGSSQNFDGTTALTFTLGSQLIVTAGTPGTLQVRADLYNAANTSYTAGTVTVNGSLSNVQGTSSLYTASNVTLPTSNNLTIQTGLLSVSKNSAFVNQTVTPNTNNALIGSFVLNNTSSTDPVRVTNLNVSIAFSVATNNVSTNLSNLYTSVGGVQATPINPATGNSSTPSVNNFSLSNLVVAPGTSQTVNVYASLGSQAAGTITTTLGVTALSQTANTTITVSPATGQVISLGNGTFGTPTLLSSSTTTAQYIATGTSTGASQATEASFNLVESNGTASVQELRFKVAFSGSNDPVTSVTVNGVTAPVVYDGTEYIADLNLGSAAILIPNNGSGANINAYLSYAPVGTSGVTSGTTAVLTLASVRYTTGNSTTTTCISGYTIGSANCTNNSLATVAAPTITLLASKPVLTVPSTTNTSLILGAFDQIGQVTVAADAGGNISVNQIGFQVGSSGFASGPTLTGAVLDIGTTVAPGLSGGACSVSGSTVTCAFSTPYIIAGGTSQTFNLYATVNGTASASSTASVSTQLIQTGGSGFQATDIAGSGSTGAITGGLIYNFPTNSYSNEQ